MVTTCAMIPSNISLLPQDNHIHCQLVTSIVPFQRLIASLAASARRSRRTWVRLDLPFFLNLSFVFPQIIISFSCVLIWNIPMFSNLVLVIKNFDNNQANSTNYAKADKDEHLVMKITMEMVFFYVADFLISCC